MITASLLALAGCSTPQADSTGDGEEVTADADELVDDDAGEDAGDDPGDGDAEDPDAEPAGNADCDSAPMLVFTLSGAESGSGETEQPSYEAEGDGTMRSIGFADSELDANLDVVFPADFTVGQPVDLAAAAGAGPEGLAGGEVAGTDYTEVVAGTLTVTATGENIFPTVCGTFEMTLRSGDGSEVEVEGTFDSVPDVG